MEYTPGPWRSSGIVAGEQDAYVWPWVGGPTVATVHGNKDANRMTANARLIAAAPELYEALRSAAESLEQLVKLNRIPANNKGLRDARAALAKVPQ